MSETAPERQIWLVRHGETEWAKSGRHTGRSDIPLTDVGRRQAEALAGRLAGHRFALVLTSPRSRATETAHLAGFPDAIVEPDLGEWDYGEFEGRTTARHPDRDPRVEHLDRARGATARPSRTSAGAPTGSSSAASIRPSTATASCSRTGTSCACSRPAGSACPPTPAGVFALGTATIGVLGWERDTRVIETLERDRRLVLTSRGFKMSGRHSVGAGARTRGST